MKSLIIFCILLFIPPLLLAEGTCTNLFGSGATLVKNRTQYLRLPSYYELSELSSIYINNKERFLVHKSYKLNLLEPQPSYKGIELKKIENLGGVNSGIYEFIDPLRGPSVLKLFKFNEIEIEGFKLLEVGSPAVSKENLDVVSYIRGSLLSQGYGGPKLYDSGFIKTDRNVFYFYIHMERIFPGVDFISVKDNVLKLKKNIELKKILKKHPHIIEDVKNLFEELAKKNIVPFDPDIALTVDGRVRWIDTDYWELGTPEQTRLSMIHIVDLLTYVNK